MLQLDELQRIIQNKRISDAKLTKITNLTNLIPISFENKILKRLRRLVIIVSKKQLAAKS